MLQNFRFPLHLFFIFEKVKPLVWTSNTNNPNHYFIGFPNEWFFALNKCLKNDLLFSQTILVETSALDSLHYWNLNNEVDFFFKKNRIIPFFTYYSFFLKLRLTFFMLPISKNSHLTSIDSIFLNAHWLERELSEMFGLHFLLKKDSRKLLLDYTFVDAPMLKDFSCENSYDNFYNILEERVSYIRNNIIEL